MGFSLGNFINPVATLAGFGGGGGGGGGSILDMGKGILGSFFGGPASATDLSGWAKTHGDPFGDQRAQYQQQLSATMANPASVADQPGYKFGLDQGIEALMRKMAQMGLTGSGNEMTAITSYATDYANQNFMNYVNMLAGLGGANIAPQLNPAITAQKNAFDESKGVLKFFGDVGSGAMTGGPGGALGGMAG